MSGQAEAGNDLSRGRAAFEALKMLPSVYTDLSKQTRDRLTPFEVISVAGMPVRVEMRITPRNDELGSTISVPISLPVFSYFHEDVAVSRKTESIRYPRWQVISAFSFVAALQQREVQKNAGIDVPIVNNLTATVWIMGSEGDVYEKGLHHTRVFFSNEQNNTIFDGFYIKVYATGARGGEIDRFVPESVAHGDYGIANKTQFIRLRGYTKRTHELHAFMNRSDIVSGSDSLRRTMSAPRSLLQWEQMIV